MPPDLPQPSRLLVAASCAFIALNLFLVAICVAMVVIFFVADLNPIAFVGAFLFVPPSLLVARLQYRGTFHGTASAASTLSILLYCFVGIVVFAFVTNVGEGIAYRNESLSDVLPFALAFGLICTLLCGAAFALARLNGNWARQLETALEPGAAPLPRRDRPFARHLITRLTFPFGRLAAMSLVVWLFVATSFPRRVEHVPADQARLHVPYGAQDISFCQAFHGAIAYEFTVDEEAFRAWVEGGIGSAESPSANIPLIELTAPTTIKRYGYLSSEPDDPEEAVASDGLFYDGKKEDHGVSALFDRTTGRGYYFADH